MAGWVAVVGSALVVATLFDSVAQIHSIEMRESVNEFLATSPGKGLGLDTAQILGILRGMMLFAGATAAAATVLAIYVLQRNNGARLGFTIAAVAIMFTAPVTGSPFSVVVAAAAMMLWTRPARDWFAGRSPASAAQEPRGTTVSSEQPPSGENPPSEWPRMPDPSGDRPAPPPTQGFGSPSGPEQNQPGQPGQPGQSGQAWPPPAYGQQPQQYPAPQYGQQYGPQYGGGPGYGRPQDPDKRPTTVTIAAWLTWGFSALTLVAFMFVVLVMLAAKDDFIDAMRTEPEFEQLNVNTDDIVAAIWVVSAIVVIWCVASIVLAVLAYRRQNWARITLVVSAAAVTLFSLLAITSIVSAVTLIAGAATIALLFTGGANQWYSRRAGGYPSYPYPPQGQYGGSPYPPQQGQGEPPYPQGRPEPRDEQEPPKNVW